MWSETLSQLEDLRRRVLQAKEYLDLDSRARELRQLEAGAAAPGFWDAQARAQTLLRRLKAVKNLVEPWLALEKEVEDNLELAALLAEEKDEAAEAELAQSARALEERFSQAEFKAMFAEEMDINNCYLNIHPGAGGTESCDWASMLLRMYLRWSERHGFEVEEIDLLPGEEAGVKTAALLIKGEYAYGMLKAETGVHRLVRISPFDAGARRHTSFASVYAAPEVDDSIEIEVDEKDLRIDTYRSSGAGGQHVNKTSSAVRITHIPTNTVVQCQNERSQHKNKAQAMKYLRARLYQKAMEERQKEIDEKNKDKKPISWGRQIRSYVFHPYNLVKDLRTEYETSNTADVMDGDIDAFIEAYLRQRMGRGLAPAAAAASEAPVVDE
ncbi:MAG: peptide chain release factor 2 [Candidatus Sumerlaeota bacterium]|nr:peptide chain release factor 2 [Candidatus Sumerlaeota bacterium]